MCLVHSHGSKIAYAFGILTIVTVQIFIYCCICVRAYILCQCAGPLLHSPLDYGLSPISSRTFLVNPSSQLPVLVCSSIITRGKVRNTCSAFYEANVQLEVYSVMVMMLTMWR